MCSSISRNQIWDSQNYNEFVTEMHPPPYDGAVPPEKTPGDYAYPPAGYGYPPPTQTTNHLIMAQPFPPRYEQTPEESRSLFACLVWPLALVSCFCGGIILALIPTFFACE